MTWYYWRLITWQNRNDFCLVWSLHPRLWNRYRGLLEMTPTVAVCENQHNAAVHHHSKINLLYKTAALLYIRLIWPLGVKSLLCIMYGVQHNTAWLTALRRLCCLPAVEDLSCNRKSCFLNWIIGIPNHLLAKTILCIRAYQLGCSNNDTLNQCNDYLPAVSPAVSGSTLSWHSHWTQSESVAVGIDKHWYELGRTAWRIIERLLHQSGWFYLDFDLPSRVVIPVSVCEHSSPALSHETPSAAALPLAPPPPQLPVGQ